MKKSFLYVTICLIPVCCLAQSKKARLLVVNKGSNSVSIVDPVSLQQVAIVPVGKAPHELTVSDDGRTAYIANYGVPEYGNTISVVDIQSHKETRKIELGALYRPHCILYKNNKLYFTSEATRSIARHNLSTGKTEWVAGTGQDGAHMLVITPDAAKVYVANRGSHTVTSIGSGTVAAGNIKQVKTGKAPEGIDISPDGSRVWVGNTGDGSIDIIDTRSDSIVQHIAVGKSPIRIKFTPDGKRVIVSDSGGEEVIILDASSGAVIKRIRADAAPMGIAIAGDGKTAFIAHSNSDYISVLNLESLAFSGTVTVGQNPDGMVWVP
ncbi:MAG: YncE family protein [Chitinophagaceae bacterium]|nr:YncE family protein [Chitinophagaceae bacterium]MCW5925506.1 YncE family protein [Chitinophagaceae bacterium]